MIFELPITVIDHETGEPREVTAIINHITRETTHMPRNAETRPGFDDEVTPDD